MKKIITGFIFLICCFFGFNNIVFANSDYVILGGDSIGLKFSTGVIVSGKYKVETDVGKVKPWENSDINVGDKIIEIDNVIVNNTSNLLKYLKIVKDDDCILTIERNNKIFDTNIKLVTTNNNEKSLGLYIKDNILGVGTLTYINPDNLSFAALGHGINDHLIDNTKVSGTVLTSSIQTIKKGIPGSPGEKRASIGNIVIGTIKSNKITGVYGILEDISNYKTRKKVSIAANDEIKVGPAKIYTVIQDNIIKEYDIYITTLDKQDDIEIKGIKIKVTDKELINKTGGIIQGMSGSPIVQNNKLVGAISHVTVDNPLIGYGVYVSWMEKDLINSIST